MTRNEGTPICDLVMRLVQQSPVRKIIYIDDEPTEWLDRIVTICEFVWIGAPKEELIANQFPQVRFIKVNLEEGVPDAALDTFDDALVICINVLNKLVNPEPLTKQLSNIRGKCSWLILATPDRSRTNGLMNTEGAGKSIKWSADGFAQHLQQCGFPPDALMGYTGNGCPCQSKNLVIVLVGREAEFTPVRVHNKIAALIHVFNEIDILETVVRYLADQEIYVHLFDNWSTDGSYELGQSLVNAGICSHISRYPDHPVEHYQWMQQLQHSSQYAGSLAADWIMHHDADELRYSPWPRVPLARAIDFVDSLNYNAIDFTVANFLFTDKLPEHVVDLKALKYFDWGRHPSDFKQVKAWKNTAVVDLAPSGGHDVEFSGRRVYPLKFLMKHYPLRTYGQANRKLYQDRLPRTRKEREERQWHVQYDVFELVSEIKPWRKSELLNFDEVSFFPEYLVERISGIGIEEHEETFVNQQTAGLLARDVSALRQEIVLQAAKSDHEKIARRERSLIEQQLQISAQNALLGERAATLDMLKKSVAERDAQINAQSALLTERAAKIATLRRALIERQAQIGAQNEMIAEGASKLAARQRALVDEVTTMTALGHQLTERTRELNRTLELITQLQAEAKSLESERVRCKKELDAMYSSTSWRATAPFRLTRRLFRRLMMAFGDRRAIRVISLSGLFDKVWYLGKYPDVVAASMDPVRHYVLYGAREGRDPNSTFSTNSYLLQNPDVAAARVNPLEHYIRWGAKEGRAGLRATSPLGGKERLLPGETALQAGRPAQSGKHLEKQLIDVVKDHAYRSAEQLNHDSKLLRESGLFDLNWYRGRATLEPGIDAVEHYLLSGWRLGFEPAPDFEGELLYPYFMSAGYPKPPAITYLQLRAAGQPAYRRLSDAEVWAAAIRTSKRFNADQYAAQFGGIQGLDPVLHYVIVGEHLGIAPSDEFDANYYWERYPDVAREQISCLGHYLRFGQEEGRRPVSVAATLLFDRSRINQDRDTVLIISHEASRTGAPILAYNLVKRLRERYNVVSVLLGGGELTPSFLETSAAVIGPLSHADWHPVEAEHIARRLLRSYRIAYAIANSTESRLLVPGIATAFVPVLSLIHEFASYTRPQGAMGEGLDWSTQIIFSSDLTATAAIREHPRLSRRQIHVLQQGQCEIPFTSNLQTNSDVPPLEHIFRPKGWEHALIVLGAGFVHIRKGVDLFLSCAAVIKEFDTARPVRFVWIGDGYDVVNDPQYSVYLHEQISRSGIETSVAIVPAVRDLEAAYKMCDVFFLSSRLDPMPNVAIDAAFRKLPVVCFEEASGIASLLSAENQLRLCVVPHLDVHAAARVIAHFASDESARARAGDDLHSYAKSTFDMDQYIERLDKLGRIGIDIMAQRKHDFVTIAEDPLFNKEMFLAPGRCRVSRDQAIREFLTRWPAVGASSGTGSVFHFRRPCAGFNPQIYAHENSARFDFALINPLAHFIRSEKPEGPWQHQVITPNMSRHKTPEPRPALHVHFFYPELAVDFLKKLDCNRATCDLLLTTDTEEKADSLHISSAGYARGRVRIDVVPNRGRDLGAFLSGFRDLTDRYEIIGHLHSKRSLFSLNTADPTLGDRWREFLWQNLLGDRWPMMDIILSRFAADDRLGIVFAEDTHFCDWDGNLDIAKDLAKRMGLKETLPPFFDFPVGTMFWARAQALRRLFELRLEWNDYAPEPLPFDGTIVHALERLLPFISSDAGFRFATTHVRGVTR